MRALWIGAALLACAGGASAAVGSHGATPARGYGGVSGTAIGRSDFRGDGFSRFAGATNGGWGFRHGGYSHFDRLHERYGREARYGTAGGGLYGYGFPYGYGGYSDSQAAGPYRADLPPGEYGLRPPYDGYGPVGLGGLPSRGPTRVIGIYDHSGEGAYSYSYNGYAETPPLPVATSYASYGYSSYGTNPVDQPELTCGC